jgi:hypothetical protein
MRLNQAGAVELRTVVTILTVSVLALGAGFLVGYLLGS